MPFADEIQELEARRVTGDLTGAELARLRELRGTDTSATRAIERLDNLQGSEREQYLNSLRVGERQDLRRFNDD